jgi:hypothetical protein
MRERAALEVLDETLYALLREGTRKDKQWAKTMAGTAMRRSVPLEHFPSLFQMEGHTGFFGVIFASCWFALTAINLPPTLKSYWILTVSICLALLLLSNLSFYLGHRLALGMAKLTGISDSGIASSVMEELEIRARIWISFLSANYVIVFCVLIWLTGGIESPFVPFYVLIFVLTISNLRITHRTVWITLYYLCGILIAFIAREIWPWPISQTEFAYIRQSSFHVGIQVFFICASLLVPTVSQYLVNLRVAKHLAHDSFEDQD